MFSSRSQNRLPAARHRHAHGHGHGHGHGPPSLAFPTRLNFYRVPPSHEVSVDEFESLALARLRILKTLEAAMLRNRPDDELRSVLADAERDNLPMHPNNADALRLDDERARDNTAHFILRLAYARTEDLRAWFVRLETLLFRLRLERETHADRVAFLATLNIDMEELPPPAKAAMAADLAAASGMSLADVERDAFFVVRWTRVLDIVARRRCLLRDGKAYIPARDNLTLVVAEFRAHLERQLESALRFLPRMDEDERLVPVLSNLSKQYLGREKFAACSGAVVADDVNDLAAAHFPPCMRHLHDCATRDAHTKHVARLQYGLFLKGVGLPVDEALVFWRRLFRNITDDAFTKNYAYNVRYNYGLEGKRANFTPFGCLKIITSNAPAAGDHHGCPFRHFGADNLRAMVARYGARESDAGAIVELARAGHYQVACSRFFESSRNTTVADAARAANAATAAAAAAAAAAPGAGADTSAPSYGDVIEHPNAFFALSKALADARAAAAANSGSGGGQAAPVMMEM